MSAQSIVIVGAGHAAVRAALSARNAGHTGPITMIASEGVEAPYERPPLSKWSGQDNLMSKPIVPLDQLRQVDIGRVSGTVVSLNPSRRTLTLSEGQTVTYGRLLLATGARARNLDPAVTCGFPVHYLRDAADAVAIQTAAKSSRSAMIVGGGFIGLELTASLRGMGVDVQVLEMEQRLLSRAITADVAQIVHDLHVAHGVKFHFSAQILRMTGANTVTLKNGACLTADLIIAGVGSVPNTALATTADLAVNNGIVVDTYLRTSVPDIFAAGDCCSFPLYGNPDRMTRLESWQNAGDQGDLAGRNLVNATPEPFMQVPWFWSNQYDHVLQVAGLAAHGSDIVSRSYDVGHQVDFSCYPDGALAFACGLAPGLKVAKDIRYSLKLIGTGASVDRAMLRDMNINLKTLLRS